MKKLMQDGARLIVAPDDWDGDQLALGWVVDTERGLAWEVPVGTAYGSGYWSPADGVFDPAGYDPVPWPSQ